MNASRLVVLLLLLSAVYVPTPCSCGIVFYDRKVSLAEAVSKLEGSDILYVLADPGGEDIVEVHDTVIFPVSGVALVADMASIKCYVRPCFGMSPELPGGSWAAVKTKRLECKGARCLSPSAGGSGTVIVDATESDSPCSVDLSMVSLIVGISITLMCLASGLIGIGIFLGITLSAESTKEYLGQIIRELWAAMSRSNAERDSVGGVTLHEIKGE